MSFKLESLYPFFPNSSGESLTGGFVYIGIAGLNPELNPITVYYDELFNTPANQPLRTNNGFIIRDGSPTNIYAATNEFSVVVRDSNNRLLYSELNFKVTYQPSQWQLSIPAIYLSAVSIRFENVDLTSQLSVGQMIYLQGGADRFATIESFLFSTHTDVILTNIRDSSNATATVHASTSTAALSIESMGAAGAFVTHYPVEPSVEVGVVNTTYPRGNVLRYGAVADGDGTYVGTDNTTAFRNAAASSKEVWIPPPIDPTKGYLIKGRINVNGTDAKIFKSASHRNTILYVDDTLIAATESIIKDPLYLEGFRMIGRTKTCIGVDVRAHANTGGTGGFTGGGIIKGLRIEGFFKGLNIDSTFLNTFSDLRIESNWHGIYCDPVNTAGDDGYITTVNFHNLYVHNNSGYGIYIAPTLKSPNLNFTGWTVIQQSGLDASVNTMSRFVNCEPMSFESLYLEGGDGTTATYAMTFDSINATFNNVYENSDGGINLNGNTLIKFNNMKHTAGTPGFSGGGVNTKIWFENCVLNNTPVGGIIRLLKSTIASVRYDDVILGTTPDTVDWSGAAEVSLPKNTHIDVVTSDTTSYTIVRGSKGKSTGVAGSPVALCSMDLLAASGSAVVEFEYLVRTADGGVSRNAEGGIVRVVLVKNGATLYGTAGSTFTQNLPIGTLTVAFSVTIAANTATLNVAVTSDRAASNTFITPLGSVGENPIVDITFL